MKSKIHNGNVVFAWITILLSVFSVFSAFSSFIAFVVGMTMIRGSMLRMPKDTKATRRHERWMSMNHGRHSKKTRFHKVKHAKSQNSTVLDPSAFAFSFVSNSLISLKF